jgi:hypothetical protein
VKIAPKFLDSIPTPERNNGEQESNEAAEAGEEARSAETSDDLAGTDTVPECPKSKLNSVAGNIEA